MEDDSTGVTSIETEYVYYAKLKDISVLDTATKVEDQEQWSFKVPKSDKNACEGRLRIRRTVIDGNEEYVLTMKVDVKGAGAPNTQNNTSVPVASQSMREVGVVASKDAFEMFKLMSDQGMLKTRYTLPVEGSEMVFEVDRFKLENGDWAAWVKIDLEIKGNPIELPKLPDGFTDVIYNQKDQQTDEEKELIWRLYEEVFLAKNPGAA